MKRCDDADHTHTHTHTHTHALLAYAESLPEGTQPVGGEKGEPERESSIKTHTHTHTESHKADCSGRGELTHSSLIKVERSGMRYSEGRAETHTTLPFL